MQRIPFDHADEISLRLSEMADVKRMRVQTSASAASRIDLFMLDIAESQWRIAGMLHRGGDGGADRRAAGALRASSAL